MHVLGTHFQVVRLPGNDTGGDRKEGHGVVVIALDVQWHLIERRMPQPAHITEMAALQRAAPVDKVLAASMVHQDFAAAAMIPRQISDQVGGAGGDSNGKFVGQIIRLNEGVEHTSGENTAHSTALNHQSRFFTVS